MVIVLGACSGPNRTTIPTVQPRLFVTAGPTQNVPATATAYAVRAIATPVPGDVYVVRPGDTLGRIADDHETTVDELMALNNLSNPDLIEVGQSLRLPRP